MATSTTFNAPFLRSLLPPDTKIPRPRISFRVKTTDIDNQYDLYSRTCSDGSSMLERVDLTVLYAPVAGICSICIITSISSVEVLITPRYCCLGHLQWLLEYYFTRPCRTSWYQLATSIYGLVKNKTSKTSIRLKKSERIMHQAIKSIQGTKPDEKFWYYWIKYIFITVKMIKSSSDHAILSWIYKIYPYFFAFKTDDVLKAIHNKISFVRIVK